MSEKVKVTVEIDPDEVREIHKQYPWIFEPDILSPSLRWRAEVCRQVFEALPPPPPPEPKFWPGDRVVVLAPGVIPDTEPEYLAVPGRTGSVTHVDGNEVTVAFDEEVGGFREYYLYDHQLALLAPEGGER